MCQHRHHFLPSPQLPELTRMDACMCRPGWGFGAGGRRVPLGENRLETDEPIRQVMPSFAVLEQGMVR